MNKRGLSRTLSVLLLVVMVVSMLPVSAYADGTATYTQITSAEELVTGQYVMVTSTGYAPGVFDGTWVTAVPVTTPDADSPVWTITVNGDGTVTLTDANSVSIAPVGGDNNGIKSGSYNWAVKCAGSLANLLIRSPRPKESTYPSGRRFIFDAISLRRCPLMVCDMVDVILYLPKDISVDPRYRAKMITAITDTAWMSMSPVRRPASMMSVILLS